MFDASMNVAGAVSSDAQQIARGLRERDITLLHTLVVQYQHRLVRYLIYLLGARDGVDDLVQETWLRVLERGKSYNGTSRFEPWLFTIARNLAMDSVRRRRTVSLDTNAKDDTAKAQMMPVAKSPSPFEQAARTEDAERLAHSLQTLEPIYREAMLLRFQEDLSLLEMAAVTGASVSTVSSRIYRGLATLRERMEGERHAR